MLKISPWRTVVFLPRSWVQDRWDLTGCWTFVPSIFSNLSRSVFSALSHNPISRAVTHAKFEHTWKLATKNEVTLSWRCFIGGRLVPPLGIYPLHIHLEIAGA